jgi:hypothetical protein
VSEKKRRLVWDTFQSESVELRFECFVFTALEHLDDLVEERRKVQTRKMSRAHLPASAADDSPA